VAIYGKGRTAVYVGPLCNHTTGDHTPSNNKITFLYVSSTVFPILMDCQPDKLSENNSEINTHLKKNLKLKNTLENKMDEKKWYSDVGIQKNRIKRF